MVIAMRMNWRMGYHRAGALAYKGDSAFGHYGFGGSGGWADPATGLSFGFVTNDLRLLQAPVGGDPRIFRLSGLVLRLARSQFRDSPLDTWAMGTGRGPPRSPSSDR